MNGYIVNVTIYRYFQLADLYLKTIIKIINNIKTILEKQTKGRKSFFYLIKSIKKRKDNLW